MTAAVDRLASALADFYFGRIDVRYDSVASLRRGIGFRVMEINGVGSEATHIWDPRTKLLDAWRTLFFHYMGPPSVSGPPTGAEAFAPASCVRCTATGRTRGA